MGEFDTRRAAMELVTAFVSNNTLTVTELPTLLTQVFNAISGLPGLGLADLPEQYDQVLPPRAKPGY